MRQMPNIQWIQLHLTTLSNLLLCPGTYCTHICHTVTRKQPIENREQVGNQILVWFMVFNVTFNNISVISWQSVLLVDKTTDLSQVTDNLYHITYQVHLVMNEVRTHNCSGGRH